MIGPYGHKCSNADTLLDAVALTPVCILSAVTLRLDQDSLGHVFGWGLKQQTNTKQLDPG
jgi:hypothetical protein